VERALEASVRVEAEPEPVIEILSRDPAGILTGMPSPDTDAFLAEIAVDLGGGASLAHEVDVAFGRLSDDGRVGRFALSWHAHDHKGALPAFGGDLEVHPDGNGSRLHLSGHYSLPLGPVGGFGDRLLGHRIARRSVQALLEAAGARIDAELAHKPDADGSMTRSPTENVTVTIEDVHTELYLG
jgi:hypothetical protein